MVHTNFRKTHTNGGHPALPARACPHAGGRAGSFGAARRQAPCGAALNFYKATVRDRVLHHALFRVLNPVFEPTFIPASFSCRIERGRTVA